jgi:hypothetical protein
LPGEWLLAGLFGAACSADLLIVRPMAGGLPAVPVVAMFSLLGVALIIGALSHRPGAATTLLYVSSYSTASLFLLSLSVVHAPRLGPGTGLVLAAAVNVVPVLVRVIRRRHAQMPWHEQAWRSLLVQVQAAMIFVAVTLVAPLARLERAAWLEVAGLSLTMVGAVVQRSMKKRGISIGRVDYNTVFHILVAGAVVLLYGGMRLGLETATQ